MKSAAREKIREAALGLFAEKGYAATSTREICQRAGVTKPVLYYHFESKEQLYRGLVLDACNESRKQLLLASRRGKTTREKLIDVLAADWEHTRREPKLHGMFLRMAFSAREGEPAVDYVQLGMEWVGSLTEVVKEGVRRGELHGRPREIAEALAGSSLLYSMGYLLTGKPKLDRNLARRAVDLVVRGCGSHYTDR